jgi:non-haem Fe2+, alpha-ketoglutarate-dependent halogenase
VLTPTQVEQFWAQGYLSGIRVLSAPQAAKVCRHLERLETPELTALPPDATHPLNRLVTSLATHPLVVAAVRQLLGGVGGIRNGDLFIKEPGLARGIEWHVDTAMPWPAARGLVNTWLALTPSTTASGCLQVLPGLHTLDLKDGPQDKHSLTLSRSAVAALDVSQARPLELESGCLSIHHFRTPHRSAWNRTETRRIGVVGRWVGPDVTPEIAESGQLLPVGGPVPAGFQERSTLKAGWRSNRVR